MSRLFFLFFVFLGVTGFRQVKNDVIVKHNGDRLSVKVLTVDEKVTFTYPDETVSNTISLNCVSEIIFSNGRVQKCSDKIEVNGEDDWEKVIITNNPNDVSCLVRKGEVRSTANNTWSFKGKMSLDKKATRKIKKEAASLKAYIILLQDQTKTNTTFVTGASSSKYGIAYSYQ